MTAEDEQRIRDRAYFIWEKEGRPHGRDLEHRLRAEAEIAAEQSRGGITAFTEAEERRAKTPQDRHDVHDGGRNSGAMARQAAEALFTAKPKATSVQEGGAARRKSRVLPVLPTVPTHHDELRNSKEQTRPKIARSEFARIRTLVRYGMTARQVAEVYGVSVGEIYQIVRVT